MRIDGPPSRRVCFAGLLGLCGMVVVGGCAQRNPTPDTARRQEQALADPFGYGASVDDKPMDVSGGGLNEFDRDGFKRDVDSLFNP